MLGAEHAETCPVPLDFLTQLYRSEPHAVAEMIRPLDAADKASLAVYCYGRSHFRELGLTIAGCCDAASLIRIAGVMGQILSAQSRGRITEFGMDGVKATSIRRKVTLARAAA